MDPLIKSQLLYQLSYAPEPRRPGRGRTTIDGAPLARRRTLGFHRAARSRTGETTTPPREHI